MNKVELLAPAGDLEKLKYALIYGADAVYLGGEIFGLRAASKNFTIEQMKEGVAFAHSLGKKVYLVLNIIPHNEDLELLTNYLNQIKDIPIDAVILSDPGTMFYVKEVLPNMEIHLSTQASNTNYLGAKFWNAQGVKRIVLARELSLDEISNTVFKTMDTDLEYEVFIHGAMCISYSGRCLLSNYMASRDANKGDCAQACRWNYKLVEEKRPNQYFDVFEDERGTYIFNSKDLCMINHIEPLIKSGVRSLKIEGRNKTVYYVSNIVRAYREAIDKFYENPTNYEVKKEWFEEVRKASHREFTTGFNFKKPDKEDQLYTSAYYIREYEFIAVVDEDSDVNNLALVEQRNKFSVGDKLEIIGPNFYQDEITITNMYDQRMQPITTAPHAQQKIYVQFEKPVRKYFILRKRNEDE
jgi:putative protease